MEFLIDTVNTKEREQRGAALPRAELRGSLKSPNPLTHLRSSRAVHYVRVIIDTGASFFRRRTMTLARANARGERASLREHGRSELPQQLNRRIRCELHARKYHRVINPAAQRHVVRSIT